MQGFYRFHSLLVRLVPFAPETRYERELVLVVVGVFPEEARGSQGGQAVEFVFGGIRYAEEVLVVEIQHRARSHGEFVGLVNLVLVEQVEPAGMLAGKVLRGSEPRVHVLVAVVQHHRYVLGVVLVERNSEFYVSVYGTVQYGGTPAARFAASETLAVAVEGLFAAAVGRNHHMSLLAYALHRRLSAATVVTYRAHSETQLQAARGIVEPAVGQVELQGHRVVEEAVPVVVHSDYVSADVPQDHCTPAVVELQGRGQVEVGLRVVHKGEVQEEGLLIGRLAVLEVYLPRHRLHSVDHRGGSLGYLYAFEPLPGNV